MLRKIVKPTTREYVITLPKEYVNKEIEIVIIPLGERETDVTNEGRRFLNLLWSTVKNKPEASVDWEIEWEKHLEEKYE